MSQTEQEQLEQCMEHLASILDRLGVKDASFSNGTATIDTSQQPVNGKLLNNFCRHISSLYKEELTEEGEDDVDPDLYFSV